MLDIPEILREYWKPLLYWDSSEWSGVAVTLWLLVISVGLGFILSIPLAIARTSSNPWLRWPVWVFTFIFRGTPLYVQILLIYSGLISLDFIHDTPVLADFFYSGFRCLILALTLNTMAYTTETFAGFLQETPAGEVEAARACGMSGGQIYRRILIPSMLRRSIPAYSNEVILMIHSTSLAFTATVPDILKVVRDINAETLQTYGAYGTAALLYMILSFIFVWLFRRFEKKWLSYM